jgi:hypothetical protein
MSFHFCYLSHQRILWFLFAFIGVLTLATIVFLKQGAHPASVLVANETPEVMNQDNLEALTNAHGSKVILTT